MCSQARALEFVPSEWEAAAREADSLHIRYAPGELICQYGSYVAGVQFFLSGVASQFIPTSSGSMNRCDLLGPGDLIGIEVLADQGIETSRSACAAITGVELLFFEGRAFSDQLLRNPALTGRVLSYLASRHVGLQVGVPNNGSDSVALCELLLRLDALCGGSKEFGAVTLPEEIAPRTIQELSGLSGRRFRSAWDAIDSLEVAGAHIVFARDVLLQLVTQPSLSGSAG